MVPIIRWVKGSHVRVLSVVAVALGVVGLLLALLLVMGNNEIASPGPSLLPDALHESWRFLLGIVLWGAAVWFTVGFISGTGQPGVAWLSLLAYVLLFAVFVVLPGLMIDFVSALVCIVVFGVGLPVVVILIARAIGNAARRRRSMPAPFA
jgi:hypothetical protein